MLNSASTGVWRGNGYESPFHLVLPATTVKSNISLLWRIQMGQIVCEMKYDDVAAIVYLNYYLIVL